MATSRSETWLTCTSGKWVESCKEFLDEAGVQLCRHSARKKGIKIKVHGSCQPNQIGNSLIYSTRGTGNDQNTGTCYFWTNHFITPNETTCGVDFTEITCGKTPEEEYALVATFTFHKKNIMRRIYTVRGKDRQAWHIVLLIDDAENIRIFHEKVKEGLVDVADYEKVIKSGWGQDPPQEVEDWFDRISKGLETLY